MTGAFHDGGGVVVGKARYSVITCHEVTELAEHAGRGYLEWLLHA